MWINLYMNLCKYKNIFGKPNEGIHSYRLFDVAIVDLLFTIIMAYLLANYLNKSFVVIFLILFVLGELMHYLFCVDTKVINFLTS
jgi:hypothetical protein